MGIDAGVTSLMIYVDESGEELVYVLDWEKLSSIPVHEWFQAHTWFPTTLETEYNGKLRFR